MKEISTPSQPVLAPPLEQDVSGSVLATYSYKDPLYVFALVLDSFVCIAAVHLCLLLDLFLGLLLKLVAAGASSNV
uniref:Atg8e n=1 Tax=Arundo donax TaxID=35708 RepID=A0A0A9G2I2_ARUDO